MTVRNQLTAKFTTDWREVPDLADVWVVASQDEVTVSSVVTAIVSQQSVGPNPEAPLAMRNVGITIELVSPLSDTNSGADQLDPIVPALLDYLDRNLRATKPTATAMTYGGHFGYQIPITVIAEKET